MLPQLGICCCSVKLKTMNCYPSRLPALLLLAAVFCCLFNAHAQDHENYLLIRFTNAYDFTFGRTYYLIEAEPGAAKAGELYQLKRYNFFRKANNTEAKLYTDNPQADSLYNYFISPTEGLGFMTKNGWTLVTIFTETSSDSKNVTIDGTRSFPVTTINSRTVYCFRK